jgi:GMP synthase-like glutamine amidotransferase
MLRILSLEHARGDGPGKILSWVTRRGHALQRVLLHEGHVFPPQKAFDFLIVLGGPMSIYQHTQYPWLAPEKEFIRTAAEARKPILGICLGAQLLADVLGGVVVRNPEREVGWWPVTFIERGGPFAAFPETLTPCHWHNDTFTLPPDAMHVASSAACQNQAFRIGDRLVGLQFHLEIGRIEANELAHANPDDLKPAPFVQSAAQLLNPPPETADLEPALDSLLDALAACVTVRSVR